MKRNFLLILSAVVLLTAACSEDKQEVKKAKNEKPPKELGLDDEQSGEFEDYIALVENNDSLVMASTMYFAKESGESYQVYLSLDSASNVIKSEEQYTRPEIGGSILHNVHYFRNGRRIASKEIYNEGEGENEMFFERVTYYDENEEPIISKRRSARFEDYLENEMFDVIEPVNVPMDRLQRALSNEGEFNTKFMGIISQAGLFYIQVGEGKKDGFTTTLVVQQVTPLIQDMINNPDKYKGKEVDVDFREMPDGQGYTFQALLGIKMADK